MTFGPQDVTTVAELAAVTFVLGLLVGFVGAGGAGFAVAILTTVFGLPVHTAIGTALAAMLFVTLSGAISHIREGNVALRLGLVVGLAGAAGAVLGADISQDISERALGIAAGLALWGLAVLVWARSRIARIAVSQADPPHAGRESRSKQEWLTGASIGAGGGVAAAILGIGMAPFLQLGFLTVHRLPLHRTVGTTMLTLVFISASGGIAMALHGDVSVPHLIGLTIGLASGAFIGARFTRRAPRPLLRATVVAMPIAAGAMLLFL